MSKLDFTHLHVHSHYSLLDGLAKLDGLIGRTAELGMNALALTDHGTLYGAVSFYQKAKEKGIKPIIGMEAYVAPGSRHEKNQNDARYYHLTLLAKNFAGYQNLVQLSTKGFLEGFYYKPRVDKELLRQHSDGIIALSGCISGQIPRLLKDGKLDEAGLALDEYISIFGKENFFIEIQRHPQLTGSGSWQSVTPVLVELARKKKVPLVATNDVHYLREEDAEAHEVLLAVQTGGRFNDDDRLTLKGAELWLKSPEEMSRLFSDLKEAAENTKLVAQMIRLELPLGAIHLPPFPLPEGATPEQELSQLAHLGLTKRYGENISQETKARLGYELDVIAKTRFASYFLIVADFISWAKERGIIVGPGRGSSAGSLVSYLLGITDIDPLKYGLLFERFLNPDRIQMPDIDVDFTDTRRDEVIAYVREKYGQDRVAQIITFGTMAARASVRDVTRALGHHWSFADSLAKLIPFGMTLEQAVNQIEELKLAMRRDPEVKRVIETAKKLEGVARHASTHASGVVIADRPLTEYLPLQFDPKERNIISQYDMYSVEVMGLLKIDFLGLKNLRLIEETIELVKKRSSAELDLHSFPIENQETFELLQKAETIGIFQLESGGMRRYLKELHPTNIEDIIVMVSAYRPGPMELIPSYIARKHGREKVTYLHPKLTPILEPTYGIGIYQEQMMRIARDLAGYTLAEADTLRKAIGKKIKSLLNEQREKLIAGMLKRGISKKQAEAIWELFPPFARYGFNRSHGACYALIAYQTAYLKVHYPAEFMTSLLNVESGDVERVAVLIEEAKRMGLSVLPPDINESGRLFTLAGDQEIRFGFEAIKNVGSNTVAAVLKERTLNGPFSDLKDFINRLEPKELNRKTIEAMIKVGVFDRWEERGKLLANLDRILAASRNGREHKQTRAQSLFGDGAMPEITLEAAPLTPREDKMRWEKELLGLYISDHPLQNLWGKIKETLTPITEIGEEMVGYKVKLCGIISKIQHIITKTGKQMLFAKAEDASAKIEVVVFPETLERNPMIWQEDQVVIISGTVNNRNGSISIIAEEAKIVEQR